MNCPDNQPEQSLPALLPFRMDDKVVIDRIIAGLRVLAARPTLPAAQLRYLSIALLALGRLPRRTPGVAMVVAISYSFNNEMSYLELYLGSDSFRLDSGGTA